MEYVVDTYALRVRLAVDGRTMGLIAKDAKLPVETIKEVLAAGKAEKSVIDKIRLAVKPSMYFSTICPKALQEENKPAVGKKGLADSEAKTLREEDKKFIKRSLELQKKIEALCNEYSTMEVFDTINEMQGHILDYVQRSGFNLLELLNEAFETVPGFEIDKDGQIKYVEKSRKETEE